MTLGTRFATVKAVKKTTPLLATAAALLSLLLLASACGNGESPFGVKSELVTAADHPVAIAFAPDGRLFYAEQFSGNIRVVTAEGELLEAPFAHLDVALYIEWGLTGLALDPDFESNHYLYALFTEPVDPDTPVGRPVVVRFTERDNQGIDPKVIVGDLATTVPEHPGLNANGRIHFGPDGYLYISLGDYDTPELVQDLSTPVGKILRVNKEDGTAARNPLFINNPDADRRIFAYGFREPFDFAFQGQTGQIYGSDNTSAGTCEELNLIQAGANYGWPQVGEFPYADCLAGEQTKAIHFFAADDRQPGDFLSFVNVSSLEFVSGDVYPLLGDSLLVCESETRLMRRLILSGAALDQVTDDAVVVQDCQLAIATSPDGTVYYSNENEIRRLVPQETGQ